MNSSKVVRFGALAVISVVGMLLGVAQAHAAPALVQATGTVPSSSNGTTIGRGFSAPVTAGDLIVVGYTWGSASANASCADNRGDTFTVLAPSRDGSNNQSAGICYALNAKGGVTNVTTTFTATVSYTGISLQEFSGIAAASALDVSVSNQVTAGCSGTNCVTSGLATTATAGDLIVGYVTDDWGANSGTITPGTNFTVATPSQYANFTGQASEYLVQAAPGSIAATFTFSGSNHSYIAYMAAFKAGTTIPDTTPPSVPTGLTAAAVSASQVNLSWTASTDNVGVAGYKVYRGGTQIASTTATSYSDTGLTASTTYIYTVAAYDAAGNVSAQSGGASATTPALPDTTPPTATITAPAQNATVTSTITLAATASDNVAVASVQFTVDGVNIGAPITSAPYQIFWNTTTVGNATHTVSAIATDTSGNTAIAANVTVTVSNTGGSSSTPAYANNGVSCSNVQGEGRTSYDCPLPNPTGSGNALVVIAQWGNYGNITATVSDDKGNVYTQAVCDSGIQRVCAYVALNIAPGTRVVTVTPTDAATYLSAAVYEFYNIAPTSAIDGTCTASGTGASPTCSSAITPSAANDLVVFWAVQDQDSAVKVTWTPGPNPWILRSADGWDQTGMEYEVLPTAAAVTPTMTISPSDHFDGVGLALKTATAGTAPAAGIRVAYLQHIALPQYSNGCTSSPCTQPLTVEFPCSGNLVVASWIGAPGYDIQSFTSTPANTWISSGAPVYKNTSGDSQLYYAANANCSATTTITLSVGPIAVAGGSTLDLFDVVGAASSPFDATAGVQTCTGTESLPGIFTTCTITPSTPNELVVAQVGIDSNTINGISPGNFLSSVPTPIASPDPTDENNGWGINYSTNTAPESFVWTTQGGTVGDWGSLAAAFKGSSGSDTTPPSVPTGLTVTGVTTSTASLSWTASTDNVGVTGYNVYRSGSQVGTSTLTTYTDTGLAPSTTYTYTVAAYDAAGNVSTQSASVNATTQSNGGGGGATPALVQWKHDPLQTGSGITYYQTNLPNPSPGGNLLVLSCEWGDTTQTPTISDNKGETWTTAKIVRDAGNESAGIFYVANSTAGVQAIRASFASTGYVQCEDAEAMNIATTNPVDAVAGAVSAVGTSHATGAMTTAVNGDLVYHYSIVDNTNGTQANPLQWTAGTGFNLLSADGWSMTASQYEVQSTAGSVNPTLTSNKAVGTIDVAVAFRAAAAGNPLPSGIQVQGVENIEMSANELVSVTSAHSTLQAPVSTSARGGDVIALVWGVGGGDPSLTSVTSNPANTWTNTPCNPVSGPSEIEGIAYAAAATKSSAGTISLTYAATPNYPIVSIYDIIGANAAPYDTCAGATGSSALISGVVAGPTITPATPNELIIGMMQEDSETVEGVSPGDYVGAYYNGYQYTSLDQDGGYMLYADPSTSAVTVNWTYANTENNTPIGSWESIVAAFVPGSSTPDTQPPTVPTGLTVTGTTTSTASLSWTASTDNVGVTGYKIYRGGSQIATTSVTSFTNTGLAASTTYSYQVSAYDAAGNVSAQSSPANATTQIPPDTTPPTVTITAPAQNATVTSTITLAATASDDVGVASVQFTVDGANFGSVLTASPYTVTLDTTTLTNGTHTISAFAKDAAGNTGTAANIVVTVANPDIIPPSVPTGLVAIAVSPSQINLSWVPSTDNVGVAGYQVYRNGSQVAIATSTSYQDTGLAASTTYTYTVVAYDAAGNVSAQSGAANATTPALPDTTPPTVTITAPAQNATVTSTVTLVATATDNVGVTSVQFTVDGANIGAPLTSSPYQIFWNTTTVGNATHTISAFAKDAAGNTGTAANVAVTVANPDTTPPSVPANLTVTGVTTSTASLSWTASTDNVGVSGYNVYRNGTQVGTTANPSYTDTGLAPSTTYTYTVAAYDAAGNVSGRSTAANATTQTPPDTTPPTVTITAPAQNATVTSTITLAATASDNVGVAKVQFLLDGANFGAADTVAPYQISWGTASSTNGAHTIGAIAYDTSNNTSTVSVSVTVANPPVITAVTSSGISTSTATITWTTNITANSQVEYGTSIAYGSLTTLNGSLVTSHSVLVSGLATSTLYHYRVRSADGNGNLGISSDFTFTTASGLASAPALIQATGTVPSSSNGTTIGRAFGTPVTAGDLIVVGYTWGSASANASCADNKGDTFVVLTPKRDTGNNQSAGICYALNAKGGTTNVTTTFTASVSYTGISLQEFSNIAAASAFDGSASNQVGAGCSGANCVTSTATTTTATGDLIVGYVTDDWGANSGTITPGTNFTIATPSQYANFTGQASEYMVQAAPGSTAATFTFSANSHSYIAYMAAFKKK